MAVLLLKLLASFLILFHQLSIAVVTVRPASKSASLPPAYQSKTLSLAAVTPTSRPASFTSVSISAFSEPSNRPSTYHTAPSTTGRDTYTYTYSYSSPDTTAAPSLIDDGDCYSDDAACDLCYAAVNSYITCSEFAEYYPDYPDYIYGCLCYETFIGSTSLIWSPDYYDQAAAQCLSYASSAAPDDIETYQSYTSICADWGNQFGAQLTDYGTLVFNGDTEEATSDSGTETASETGDATTTAAPTASSTARTGGCSRQYQYSNLAFTLFIITLLAIIL